VKRLTPIQDKRLEKKHCWWWRWAMEENERTTAHFWKGGQETSSHTYELVRRLHRGDRSWPPLVDNPFLLLWLPHSSVAVSFHYELAKTSNKSHNDQWKEPGWTFALQWNLRASDSALFKRFRKFIAYERRRKGMIDRRAVVRLPPKRHPSWKWLEIWDRHEIDGEPLSNSEHGALTKAKQRAKQQESAIIKEIELAERKKSELKIRQ
jgi:hypothetical protein